MQELLYRSGFLIRVRHPFIQNETVAQSAALRKRNSYIELLEDYGLHTQKFQRRLSLVSAKPIDYLKTCGPLDDTHANVKR